MPNLQNISSLQKNGQVTIPMDFRRKYQLGEGDPIVFLEVADGLLISKNQSLSLKLLDEMRNKLEEKGVTLEDLLKGSNNIKKDLLNPKIIHKNSGLTIVTPEIVVKKVKNLNMN